MTETAQKTKKFGGVRLALTIVLSLVALTAAEVAWQYNYPAAHAAANFTLHDKVIRVSQPEAQQLLNELYESKTLVLVNDSAQQFEATLPELGAEIDTANQIDTLFAYPTWQRLVPYSYFLNFFNSGALPAPDLIVGNIPFASFPAQEAIILNEEGNLQVSPAAAGFTFDEDELKQQLRQLELDIADTQNMPFSFAIPQPQVSTEAAQQVVDTVLANSADGVTVHFEAHSIVIPQVNVLSWLSFYSGDDVSAINLTLSEDEVRSFVTNSGLELPASTVSNTVITYTDGVQTSRQEGQAGISVNFTGLTSAIVASLQGSDSPITVTTIERKPKIEYVDNFTSEFIRKSVEERMSAYGGTFVDVNLSTQHLTYVKDYHVVLDSAIVSGRPGMDTPTDTYHLLGKSTNTYLVGADYRTKVAYWMPFIGSAYGLHDATWQASFGGNRWKTGYGSHGCVNMPLASARELYGLINVGDVVFVHW